MDMGPVGVIRNRRNLEIPLRSGKAIIRPITLTTCFVSAPRPVPGYSSVALTTGNRTGGTGRARKVVRGGANVGMNPHFPNAAQAHHINLPSWWGERVCGQITFRTQHKPTM